MALWTLVSGSFVQVWFDLRGNNIHCHGQFVVAAAGQNAAHRAYVSEVAAPGNGDVSFGGKGVIGRIEIDPAEIETAPSLNPGVGSIGSN